MQNQNTERQSSHFRRLQAWSFVAVNLHLVVALIAVALAIYFLPKEKYDLVREVIGIVLGYILNEWKTPNQYFFGTSASSAKANEAIRNAMNQPDKGAD